MGILILSLWQKLIYFINFQQLFLRFDFKNIMLKIHSKQYNVEKHFFSRTILHNLLVKKRCLRFPYYAYGRNQKTVNFCIKMSQNILFYFYN